MLGLDDEAKRLYLQNIAVKPWNNPNHVLYETYGYRAAYGSNDLICQKNRNCTGKNKVLEKMSGLLVSNDF